jgi:Undecaprenyl-phosphate glucose phosphotransferase
MALEYTTQSDQRARVLPEAIVLPTTPDFEASVQSRRLSEAVTKMAVLEFAAVGASAYLASILYHYISSDYLPPAQQYGLAAIVIALVLSFLSVRFRHYESLQTQPRHRFLWAGVGAVGLTFSLFLSGLFLFKISEGYSRGSFIFQIFAIAIVVVGLRAVSHSWLQSAIASGVLAARSVVLVGEDALCRKFAQRLRITGIAPIARLPFPGESDLTEPGLQMGPATRGIIEICRDKHPDDILLLANEENFATIKRLIRKLSELPVNVHVVPQDSMDLLATSRIAEFGNVITFQVSSTPLSAFDLLIKRGFDIVASIAGLVLLSPLLLFASIAIALDSRGPIFFRQTRHGYNRQTIKVIKFRTMTTLEDGNAFRQAKRNDDRVTRIGRILRRTNIDELPQLINVLMGDMSIVGPRPHATAHNEMFEGQIVPFARRHNVKPGITGWAQVNGARGETDTLEKMQQRIEYDLYYIDNWSLIFDVKIIVMTLFSKGAYINAY